MEGVPRHRPHGHARELNGPSCSQLFQLLQGNTMETQWSCAEFLMRRVIRPLLGSEHTHSHRLHHLHHSDRFLHATHGCVSLDHLKQYRTTDHTATTTELRSQTTCMFVFFRLAPISQNMRSSLTSRGRTCSGCCAFSLSVKNGEILFVYSSFLPPSVICSASCLKSFAPARGIHHHICAQKCIMTTDAS